MDRSCGGIIGCRFGGLCGDRGGVNQEPMSGPDQVLMPVGDQCAEQAVNALRNIGNHLEVNPKARIVVVTHARGVDFLFEGAKDKDGNPYNVKVEELKSQGVRFDVCEITLRNRKLSKSNFIPESTFVPSGVAEITSLPTAQGITLTWTVG